jgi:putative ABC transport system permease protein
MHKLIEIIRHEFVILQRAPIFVAATILTMIFGIGANTLLFCLLNAYFFKPLPFHRADRLVSLAEETHESSNLPVSYDNFRDWQQQATAFESMAMYRGAEYLVATEDSSIEGSQRLPGMQVTAGLFHTLGKQLFMGRDFSKEEDRINGNPVVIISYRFWRDQLSSDPGSLGRTLNLNGKAYVIIGILPPAFRFFNNADLFVPICGSCVGGREKHISTYVIARLKDGVSLDYARTQMQAIARRLEQQYPDTNSGHGATVTDFRESLVGDLKPMAWALGAVGALVFLIAFANVSNLLLVRCSALERDWAIRLALGASSGTLIRNFIAEVIVLSGISGILSVVLAFFLARRLIAAFGPEYVPLSGEPSIDVRVLLFTAIVGAIGAVVGSMVPAAQIRKISLTDSLLATGGGATTTKRRHSIRSALVVLEVGIALVLLISAGLVLRSIHHLLSDYPGYDAQNVLTMQLAQVPGALRSPEDRKARVVDLLQSLKSLPGVESVAMGTPLPLDPSQTSMSHFAVAGKPIPAPGDIPLIDVEYVTPEYFRVLRMQLIQGRYFTEADLEGAPIAIVNQSLARKYWPEGALNAEFYINSIPGPTKKVIGIVHDAKERALGASAKPVIYVPFYGPWSLLIRTTGDPMGMAPTVRKRIHLLDPGWAVFDVKSMEQRISDSVSQTRIAAWLLGAFACLALLLTGIGVYGIVAYSVALRSREIAIRVALGARARNIRFLLIKLMMPVVLGLLLGLVAALMFTRVLSSLLVGVHRMDFLTFVYAIAFELAVATMACYLPGRRGLKIEPARTLRAE